MADYIKERQKYLKENMLQQQREYLESQLVKELQSDMQSLITSNNPYIKNRLYRLQKQQNAEEEEADQTKG